MSTLPTHRDVALTSLLDRLRREPDVESRELRAWDAADRYLLDTAAPLVSGSSVVVIDDTHGALALGATDLGAACVRVHHDSLVAQRALEQNAARAGMGATEQASLEEVVTKDAALVLLRLPRSLDRLDDVARAVAASMSPDAVLIAGNMLKHMTPAQNEVLRASFERVDVSLARGKARLLTASGPRSVSPRPPATMFDPELDLTVVALAGVFAGASIDIGTRALVATFDDLPHFETAVDLACGSGVIASVLARHAPTARVIASDVSRIAVRSAHLTAEANGVTVESALDDGLSLQPDASADLVVLNPPFHAGAALHTGIAHRLFAEAARVLRPGGELRAVWNTHLVYRPALERMVGPTAQRARTAKFTVTTSRKRGP